MPTVHESSFANLNQNEGNTIQNEEPSFEEMLMQDPHWRNPDHKLVQEMVQLLEVYAQCQKNFYFYTFNYDKTMTLVLFF